MTSPSERLLLRLEWTVLRRLEGRLQGAHRTLHRGSGIDFAGLAEYTEGDDARHIDWNVTARTDHPHVRMFTEDRDLTVWLVVDRSASMAAGGPDRTKGQTAAELALLLARLFGRRGDRVAALLYDTGGMTIVPPGVGRRHVLRIGAALRPSTSARGATTHLAAMLDAAGRAARRPALVIVLSDFIGEGDWGRALLRLGRRHEVAALRITDRSDDELPEAGLLVVEDAETGEQLIVDSSDPLLRERFAAGVADREAAVTADARRAGVSLHRIPNDQDPIASLVEVVGRSARRTA